jgi:hypothetical protein
MNSGITDHNRLQELAKQIQDHGERIDELTLRWLELTELDNILGD